MIKSRGHRPNPNPNPFVCYPILSPQRTKAMDSGTRVIQIKTCPNRFSLEIAGLGIGTNFQHCLPWTLVTFECGIRFRDRQSQKGNFCFHHKPTQENPERWISSTWIAVFHTRKLLWLRQAAKEPAKHHCISFKTQLFPTSVQRCPNMSPQRHAQKRHNRQFKHRTLAPERNVT